MKEVVEILRKNKKTISTMESCTGGGVANAITNIEGASDILKFSAVTYSNEYKIKMGVSSDIIDKYSVYSMETANEMSKNISSFSNSNYGIGITGKLNRVDKNNLYGEDNVVFISIYDRDKNLFYNMVVEATKGSRKENKELIIHSIAEEMLEILSKEKTNKVDNGVIKNIKLFVNHNNASFKLGKLVKDSFIHHGFYITDDNFDLGIAIGGDGAFLRMIKDSRFCSSPYYVGINSGTLGFLQEVKESEIDKLIYELQNKKYKVDEIGIQQTSIYHDGDIDNFYSLNEIVIRDKDLKMAKFDVSINQDLLERFTGDGLLVASSQGSTAHNLSYGGSIVYNNFSTLQITPIAPINSKVYRTLNNSVIIPDQKEIVIKPVGGRDSLMITVDGENNIYQNVESIHTSIRDKKIKCLRFSHYNFPQKINEKLLSNE